MSTLNALGRLIEHSYPIAAFEEESRRLGRFMARIAHGERVSRKGDPRYVGISHPTGNGNAARRRMGRRAVFRRDDGYMGPESESDATHRLTWIDAAGKEAEFLPSKPLTKRPRLPR